MELRGLPWNPGTEEFVNHAIIVEYIQSVARKRDLEKDVLYNTRVEHIWKEEDRWLVRSSTLARTTANLVRKAQSIRVSKYSLRGCSKISREAGIRRSGGCQRPLPFSQST